MRKLGNMLVIPGNIHLPLVNRTDVSILPLMIKGEWFSAILSGMKREHYLPATFWWHRRLYNWHKGLGGQKAVVELRHYFANYRWRMYWEVTLHLDETTGLYNKPYVFRRAIPPKKIVAKNLLQEIWGEPRAAHYIIGLNRRIALNPVIKEDY